MNTLTKAEQHNIAALLGASKPLRLECRELIQDLFCKFGGQMSQKDYARCELLLAKLEA